MALKSTTYYAETAGNWPPADISLVAPITVKTDVISKGGEGGARVAITGGKGGGGGARIVHNSVVLIDPSMCILIFDTVNTIFTDDNLDGPFTYGASNGKSDGAPGTDVSDITPDIASPGGSGGTGSVTGPGGGGGQAGGLTGTAQVGQNGTTVGGPGGSTGPGAHGGKGADNTANADNGADDGAGGGGQSGVAPSNPGTGGRASITVTYTDTSHSIVGAHSAPMQTSSAVIHHVSNVIGMHLGIIPITTIMVNAIASIEGSQLGILQKDRGFINPNTHVSSSRKAMTGCGR